MGPTANGTSSAGPLLGRGLTTGARYAALRRRQFSSQKMAANQDGRYADRQENMSERPHRQEPDKDAHPKGRGELTSQSCRVLSRRPCLELWLVGLIPR